MALVCFCCGLHDCAGVDCFYVYLPVGKFNPINLLKWCRLLLFGLLLLRQQLTYVSISIAKLREGEIAVTVRKNAQIVAMLVPAKSKN